MQRYLSAEGMGMDEEDDVIFASPPSKTHARKKPSAVPRTTCRAQNGVSCRTLKAQPLFDKDVFKGRKFVLDPLTINENELNGCKQLLDVLQAVSTVHTALSGGHFVFCRLICSSAVMEWQ
jgi:hypothetical protein